MNFDRIAQRVRLGGHDVPEDAVRRRRVRGIANFLDIYSPLADPWVVFDNSGPWPREIAFSQRGQMVTLDQEMYGRFLQAGGAQ